MSRKRTNTVIPEAVRWFNRFRMKGTTALSPDESTEWARWAAEKANLAAFQRTEQLWEQLKHLNKTARPTQQDLDSDDYNSEKPISEWLNKGKRKQPSR